MNPVEFGHATLISRVADGQWHALEDDLVVGRAETSRRPDGRLFVSIVAWHGAAFGRLAEAVLAALPRPLHTMVDEAAGELAARWRRAGFAIRRREFEYAVPTHPHITGLDPARLSAGLTFKGFGTAEEGP